MTKRQTLAPGAMLSELASGTLRFHPHRKIPRKLAALGAIVVLIATVTVTLAVHDETFQLDGDTDSTTTTNAGGSTQTVDWDAIFTSAGAPQASLPADYADPGFFKDFNHAGGTTSFSTSDPSTYATGSKDTLPISGWQCNKDNNVNSKIDVMNAYTVSYTNAAGDEIVYFALERNANTGTADVGFWFLQDNVGCVSTGSAVTFTGEHRDGDILVVSEFTNGGSVSTIQVYRWDRPGNPVGVPGSLNTTQVGGGVDCRNATTLPGDSACAASNTAAITVPWLTSNKQDGLGDDLRTSEFFEGGINLTDLDLGGKCFNTFIGDTRSSTSPTATLFDFAAGTTGECGSGTVTTPSIVGSATIPNDADGSDILVHDTATITVTGADTFDATVSFHLCGPTPLADDYVLCATGGVDIGSVPVTANGDYDSADATVTSVGKYCWRADFSGDGDIPGSSDSRVNECFTINPRQSTLSTQASGSVALGQKISDTVTIGNTADKPGTGGPAGSNGSINPATPGGDATGNITVVAYGPNSCALTAFTSGAIAASGDGNYGGAASAFEFTPSLPGQYVFVAAYAGDSPNTLGVSAGLCSGAPDSEKVTVTDTSSVSTAQTWVPSDSATVHSTGGAALSGSVVFKLYNNGTCTAGAGNINVLYTSSAKTVSGAAGVDVTVQSGDPGVSVTATGLTTWSWQAVYTSGNNTQGSTGPCESTSLNIDND